MERMQELSSSSQGGEGKCCRGCGNLSGIPPSEGVLIARCEEHHSCPGVGDKLSCNFSYAFLWPLGRGSGCRERHCRVCPHVGAPRATLSLSPLPAVTVYSPEEERKGEKIYLYTHLKQQPIW